MCDPASPEIERKMDLQERKQIYLRITGKEATLANLQGSLVAGGVTGTSTAEVVAALGLIALNGSEPDEVARQVFACYERNRENFAVRLQCAKILLGIEKTKGLLIARELLLDPNAGLETQLLTATYMTDAKELDGYSILPKGLLSSNAFERRIAISLLGRFTEFDGMQVPNSSEKVNVRQLVEKVKSQTNDPKILADLAAVRF